MGNCASIVDCSSTDQPVESDPDVAGIGVLVSFGATAIITFIAIVVGYLTDSLPDSTLTELDRACIVKLQWWPWKSDGALGTLLRQSTATTTAILLLRSAIPDQNLGAEEKRQRDRARRSKGLERFILALSDQQLVTGFAVLIAGYTNRCSRSLYHFDIIAALGWFSSTTHLSTLAILRAYLIDHPRVRDWRVVAMLGIFALLGVSQIGTFSTQDNSLPVQCIFESFGPTALSWLEIIQIILIIIFLGVSYSNRTRRLYTFDSDWSVQDWIVERIVVASSILSRAEQGATYRKLQQRRRWWKHCHNWVKHRSAFRRRVVEIMYLNQEMQRSFLGEILTLLFGVSYGISQVITNRNQVPIAGLSGDQNAMSFGQLVPLLLIALPMLAAGEVYFERHDEVGSLPLPSEPFVAQLDPATLLMQDDTDAAVAKTLHMMTNSMAGRYNTSASTPRQALNYQSGFLSLDTSVGIPLSEMTNSTAAERSANSPAIAPNPRGGESITAAAAVPDDDVPAITRADTESGGHRITPPANSRFLRTPLRKARCLLIIFLLQAIFYVFFAITLAGVGAAYLYGIPAIISAIGSVVVVAAVIANFGLQVKEGWGSEET